MSDTINEIREGVIEGDRQAVERIVRIAIEESLEPNKIMFDALVPAMAEVGTLYECGDYFVPEMMISARAMQTGLDILRPLMAEAGVNPLGRVVLGTVEGDLHDIGKNLVGMMLEGAGFEVEDLGVDVKTETYISAVTDQVNVLGMSALLTTTIPKMKSVIDALEEAGMRSNVVVVVGGAPVTQEFADQIGADGYAPDASRAATVIKNLLEV